jgi:hypothetical protein
LAIWGDRFQNALDSQIHGTIPGAIPTTGAEDFLEFFRVDAKLVKDPLPLAIRLAGAGVMTGSMLSEERELAGVPIFEPDSPGSIPFIHDIETVAGGATESTGTAAQATQRLLLPERIFKMALQKFSYLKWIKPEGGARRIFGAMPGLFQTPLQQGSTTIGNRANLEIPVSQIYQQRIGAAFGCGAQSDRGAKTIIIVAIAGQGDDGSRLAPPVVKLVFEIPVENRVQNWQRSGITRPRGNNQLHGNLQIHFPQFDIVPFESITIKHFMFGEHEFFDGIRGMYKTTQEQLSSGLDIGILNQVRFDPNWPGGFLPSGNPAVEESQ